MNNVIGAPHAIGCDCSVCNARLSDAKEERKNTDARLNALGKAKLDEIQLTRDRLKMLSESHAAIVLCGLDLALLTPFQIASLAVLQGISVGMDMVAENTASTSTRAVLEAQIAKLKR